MVLYCLFFFRLSILIIIKRILYYFHVNLSRQPGIRQGCPLLDLFFSLEFDAKWNSYCFLFHEFYGQISCWKICLAPFLFLIRKNFHYFPNLCFTTCLHESVSEQYLNIKLNIFFSTLFTSRRLFCNQPVKIYWVNLVCKLIWTPLLF